MIPAFRYNVHYEALGYPRWHQYLIHLMQHSMFVRVLAFFLVWLVVIGVSGYVLGSIAIAAEATYGVNLGVTDFCNRFMAR